MTPTNLSQLLSLYFTSAIKAGHKSKPEASSELPQDLESALESVVEKYFHGDDILSLIKLALLANYRQIQQANKCYRKLKENILRLKKNATKSEHSKNNEDTYQRIGPLVEKGLSNCEKLNHKLVKVLRDLESIHLHEKQELQKLIDTCQELNEGNMLLLGDIKRLVTLH